MAYFSNGSEGEVFDNECATCIFGQQPCPIFIVQSTYNYEACNNKTTRAILNDLVKQDSDRHFLGCQMRKILKERFPQEYPE